MGRARSQIVTSIAWLVGGALFVATVLFLDFSTLTRDLGRLGTAIPEVLAASAIWHLLRTLAWAESFPPATRPSLLRLIRVRLAAEAFSFVTIRGVAGEPLKVMLLREVTPTAAAAAVALERLSYLIVTAAILGAAGVLAMTALPLAGGWFQIFRIISIGSGVVVALTAIVLAGRGQYLGPVVNGLARVRGRAEPGAIGRFALATERQLLDLARTDSRRLVILLLLQAGCYVAMAVEVWVVLRAVGVSISATGALAIETFTRAASFVSAFIPGNLGALEASNAAAVTAVGASAGASGLALARRLRGIWWAGLGFIVYPRKQTTVPTPTDSRGTSSSPASCAERPHLAVVAEDPVSDLSPFDTIAALPMIERVVRAAAAAGYGRAFIWAPEHRDRVAALARRVSPRLRVEVIGDAAAWQSAMTADAARVVTLVGPATVVSAAFLRSATDVGPLTDRIRELPAGADYPDSGVFRCTPAQILNPIATLGFIRARACAAGPGPSGVAISKGQALLTIRPADRQALPDAEATMRRATYKGTDPYLARFNRRISLPISMCLLRTPVTANAVSIVLVAVGFYAAWLFSIGSYWTGVAAAAISLAASILDGCDGEIARLKYQESSFGCWLETVGDYSYYIAIFIGMTIGAVKYTGSNVFYQIGGAALAGTLITFVLLIFLRQRITNGRPEKLQATTKAHFYASGTKWAWLVAKVSFCATRSSMPYGIFGFAVLGLLPGMVILAMIGANLYWISLAVKLKSLLGSSEREPITA